MKLERLVVLCSKIITIVMVGLIYNYAFTIFPPTKDYPAHIHKTLYLDRNFSNQDVADIADAALTWAENTNHIAEFDVELLPTKKKIDPDTSIIVFSVTQDYPDILVLDAINHNKTLGYYDGSGAIAYIALVNDRLDDELYKPVMLHELGHALGLAHNKDLEGIGTLMYPSVDYGSTTITEADLINFCKLYHCNANNLKH